jgi:hypothetical protein
MRSHIITALIKLIFLPGFLFLCSAVYPQNPANQPGGFQNTISQAYSMDRSFIFWLYENPEDPNDGECLLPCVIKKSVLNNKILLQVANDPNIQPDFKRGGRIMNYFNGTEKELYDKIKNGSGSITNTFIKELFLDRLVSNGNKNKVIAYNLVFDSCIILKIHEPENFGPASETEAENNSPANTDSLLFEKNFSISNSVIDYFTLNKFSFLGSVTLKNCIPVYSKKYTSGNVIFSNCCFKGDFFTEAVDFRKEYKSYDYLFGLEKLSVDTIIDKIYIPWLSKYAFGEMPRDSLFNTYVFDHCKFGNRATLLNSNKYTAFGLSYCSFRKRVFFNSFTDRITSPDNYHMVISQSEFLKGTDLSSLICNDFSFNSVYFCDTVFLSSTSLKRNNKSDTTFFSKSYFKHNTTIVIGKEGNSFILNSLKINPVSLLNLNIINDDLLSPKKISDQELQDQLLFYSRVSQFILSEYPADIGEKMKNRLDHESLKVEAEYDRQNFRRATFGFKYLRFLFLESVVGNGYNGEGTFVKTVVLILFLYSFIYFFFYRAQIVNYMVEHYENASPNIAAKPTLINYFRCFWISFIMLITPKYPLNIFKQKTSIFILLSVEWFLGIILIILFLVYIASKYSFIKSLIGL